MSETNIDIFVDETCNVELFESYLSAFFNFGFVFSVFFEPFNFTATPVPPYSNSISEPSIHLGENL